MLRAERRRQDTLLMILTCLKKNSLHPFFSSADDNLVIHFLTVNVSAVQEKKESRQK